MLMTFYCFDFLRCASAAKLKNYTHFGIQGYGECWSGPTAAKTFSQDGVQNTFTQRPAPKPWVGCVGDSFERCRGGDDQCVGQENSNFVYAFVKGTYVWFSKRRDSLLLETSNYSCPGLNNYDFYDFSLSYKFYENCDFSPCLQFSYFRNFRKIRSSR